MVKAKNEHGTRVARAIVCSECGAHDTLSFAPRNMERVLCRKCAAQILGVEDQDAGILAERNLKCIECGRLESTNFPFPAEFSCKDCRAGIVSRQQDRTKKAERVANGKVLRVKRG